ncbi:hypothetical protein XfCFBP8356_010470 [Xylella fastidiosa subsp. sandyi]|uniref:DUF1828 domain-containing protein n=3 Tax=Xylella fastidiosa TaxID=2371 RepID=A0A060HER4_XYLFS|nr:hypothetical protein [Xylella fastidiosa]AIC11312.1 hypothetical protein D934_07720 [Xylella fastidiosa subsp. sandyi Ann-1]AIC11397.1 hypothetical protein D934_08940 [Xylella fastidiosa subsp. sandyi Ann-1]RWA43616.1 hypothetical protein XfCFBP8356_10880 [Xylella fastidiosa subsp. sandyi]
MIMTQALLESMLAAYQAHQYSDGMLITTHCIYPTGEFVRARIYGGEESFIVSDEGNALLQMKSAGGEIENPDKIIRKLARKLGIECSKGILRTVPVAWDDLPFAVASLANASQKIAEHLFAHIRINEKRDFKTLLRKFLESSFPKNVRPETILGSSNRRHQFDTIIITNSKRIIIDPVTRDASSMNARVVANIDVKRAEIPGLDQRITYDDQEDWTGPELKLLQLAAPLIPYSKLPEVLPRLTSA